MTLGYAELLARQPADFQPTRTFADDPALMIYTSGTTGQPKGALHAHRVLPGHLPGHPVQPRVLPAPRRPDVDAGRLGLGRRPAQRAAAEPAFRRARRGPARRAVRSRGGLRVHGGAGHPQRLHPADRASHAAHGRTTRAAASRSTCAPSRRPASRSAPRPSPGARGARPRHQRGVRPDRVQLRARLLRQARRQPARRDRPRRAGPPRGGDPRRRHGCASRARSARSRWRGPTRRCSCATGTSPKRRPESSSATG